ncbi:DUF2188 domain-containing protein [Microbaculum marinum]|uniref:DUF2188 domain-containing protein n=1 Tax=Microbaculum marinum TaxID=1764581 RepID=UPI003619081E
MSGYHALPARNGWKVHRAGNSRATVTGLTEAEAWREARRRARGRRVPAYLHGRDGRIATRNDYRDHPRSDG